MIYYHILPGSPDQHLYIGKIAELKRSIVNLTLPQVGYNYFHGSAIMTLYPYLNLIPAVLFSFIIKSNILLIYFTFSFYIFITLLISFYSSIELSKSWQISYLFSIIYAMSLMYINYTFVNADVSESATLTWLPLVVFGFIKLMKYGDQWLELSIGFSLIIGTHVLNSIIIIVLILVWFVINVKKVNMIIIISAIKAILLSVITTSIIWLPAFSFIINNPSFIRPASVEIWKTVEPMSSLITASLVGRAYNGIDIFVIFEIIMGLIFYRNFSRFKKQMYIISIVIILFCSKLFPWHYMPFIFIKIFETFQFTNRFYIIPQLMLNYLFADTLIQLVHNNNAKNYLLIFISLLTIGLQLEQQYKIMSFYDVNATPLTKRYVKHNRGGNYNNIRYGFSPVNARTHLNMEAAYKIDNNKEYNNILNTNDDFVSTDYWPSNTKKLSFMIIGNRFLTKSNLQNNIHKNNHVNYMGHMYISSPSFIVHHCGSNKFSFYNAKRSEIMLPIFHYRGERIKLYDNHKFADIKSHLGLVVFRGDQGNNIINIRLLPSFHYEFSKKLTFIGLLGYMISIFMFVIKLVIDRRNYIKGDKYEKR